MLHLYDRATMARALKLDLEPCLKTLLSTRIAALGDDLIDWTEYLVIQDGDTEADIVQHIGFSPLVEPIDGGRFGGKGFHPHWDYLTRHDGWFEMIFSFGSAFAYILLVEEVVGTAPDLVALCRQYDEG